MTFNEALEEIKAESKETRTLIEECERKAILLNEAEKQKGRDGSGRAAAPRSSLAVKNTSFC